tara:strand:+ start:72 stop:914 length:843 start_codon:yes stop_codon:yes gene_type:complete
MNNNFLKKYLKLLKDNNFSYPEIELRYILNKSSKAKEDIIFSNFNEDKIDINLFKLSFFRRLNHEPTAKIFNEKFFWKYKFYVNENVLDPRPESELFIETIKKYYKNFDKKLKIIDMGTGTGCLAISLAKEYSNSKIIATDISKKALEVAKKNSLNLNTNNQIEFVNCDWFSKKETYDIIVCNPPYLSIKDYEKTSYEIKRYEPSLALIGGEDGLLEYKKISLKIGNILNYNTLCFFEIGCSQRQKIVNIFEEIGLKCIDIIHDYQKHERLLVLKRQNKY